MRIVQFSAGFNEGDAISNLMLFLKEKINGKGINCDLYSQNIGHTSGKICKKFSSYSPSKKDIVIYHHSIHSKVFEFIKNISEYKAKVLIYHNVTPYEYISNYDLNLTYYLKKGREELDEMKSCFDLNFAVSQYNRNELQNLGFRDVKILPIKLDLKNFQFFEKVKSDNFRIIFVGRIAPNKKQCDLIKLAYFLKKNRFPFILTLAGKVAPELISYKLELDNLVKYFQLENNIEFREYSDQSTLANLYSNSDLFVCMSEHEGFCVPLMEAMYYKIPILAYKAGAVPETLGSGGILFSEKKFDLLAEMIIKIKNDEKLRQKLVQSGVGRFQELNELPDSLESILSL